MSDGQEKQPVKVYLVNPPIQEPWRTQAEYRGSNSGCGSCT
jgi:hypothetical protein